MRIAIIAHGLRAGGGISVANNLISQLLQAQPHKHTFLVSIPQHESYKDISTHKSCEVMCEFKYSSRVDLYYIYDLIRRLYFEKIKLKKAIKKFNPDIVFSVGNMFPGHYQTTQILYLHNSLYVYPFKDFINTLSKKELLITTLKRFKFKRDLKLTDLLICQTETMLKRTKKMYGFNRSTLICPNVLSSNLQYNQSNHNIAILDQLKDKKILFCLSDYYLHKNIEKLIELFSAFRDELKEYVLILTINPQKSKKAANLISCIKENNLENIIFNVGPLKQKDLCHYYRASAALIMPTLLESFSTTYIEAMRYNIPILTSDRDFAREICKKAAIYFDPNDIQSIFRAIQHLQNSNIQFDSSTLISLTWQDIAKQILSTFEKLLIGNNKYGKT